MTELEAYKVLAAGWVFLHNNLGDRPIPKRSIEWGKSILPDGTNQVPALNEACMTLFGEEYWPNYTVPDDSL